MDADNAVVIVGTLVDAPDSRRSPAGIAITRLLLEHRSEQVEAGVARPVRFRIGVRAAGGESAAAAAALGTGDRVRVRGFLARLRQGSEDHRLIVSATSVERVDAQADNE